MVTPTEHQWAAIKKAKDWFKSSRRLPPYSACYMTNFQNEFVLGGYAGSGKSTCVGVLIDELGLEDREVLYMAPTGKAAKVLTKKLHASGHSNTASTIHSAIYAPKAEKASALSSQISRLMAEVSLREAGRNPEFLVNKSLEDLKVLLVRLENELRECMSSEGPTFTLKDVTGISEDVKLFVVDEASMVGTSIASDMRLFGIPILAVGDPGQLPPVGDTWGFSMEQPDAFLTEIHRQAADNPILHLATLVRQGKMLKYGEYGDDVKVVRRQHDDVTLNMDRDAMILVGTHKTRWRITKKIRQELGFTETGPMSGEPLIVCKNSQKHQLLVNGTIVENLTDIGDLESGKAILRLDVRDMEYNTKYSLECAQALFEEHHFRKRNSYSGNPQAVFSAKRDKEQLDWAHAITVHKAQGSEWDDVVVHDESGVFRDQGDRWLYTGITRAAKKLTVVM